MGSEPSESLNWISIMHLASCPSRNSPRRISLPIYGMSRWGDVITARQKLVLMTLARHVRECNAENAAVREPMAILLDRCADRRVFRASSAMPPFFLPRFGATSLLQASGRANALRSLLKSETERSPDFLRLANALSALYPKESEEKRLLDAMLLAAPR